MIFSAPLLFVLTTIVIAYLSAMSLVKIEKPNNIITTNRNVAVDGLRGYLAFFVFLHHTYIWYFYLANGVWQLPESNLFIHLGQSSVALFFMITSFLFTNKLLNSSGRDINWVRLYKKRMIRLFPLYLIAVLVIFILVAIVSDWMMVVPVNELLDSAAKWLLFSIGGRPDINGIERTRYMSAGVTWSIAYEWLFYLLLPFLAVIFTKRFYFKALVFSGVLLYLMSFYWWPRSMIFNCFVGGFIAAFAVRNNLIVNVAKNKYSSFIALILLALLMFFNSAYDLLPLFFLTLFFIIIASGNDLFGVLSLIPSRWLGEISYGIYLFHGLVMFVVFYFLLGYEYVISLTEFEYSFLVMLIAPFVILVAHVLHVSIERPFMNAGQFKHGVWRYFKTYLYSKRA